MPVLTYTTSVERAELIAPHVRSLVLQATDPPLLWRAGQWISLHLPVGERPPTIRAYTLAEPPAPDGHMTLVFDRVPEGVGTDHLFSIEPGEEITFGMPQG